MKPYLPCVVVQLVLAYCGSTEVLTPAPGVQPQEHVANEDDNAWNPVTSKRQDILSSFRRVVEKNELLEERIRDLEKAQDENYTVSLLVKKLDEVSAQLESNSELLRKIELQQEEMTRQLADQKENSISLLSNIKGFLMVDKFNSESNWHVLKKGLAGLLDHSDVAYHQLQELSSGDVMPVEKIVSSDYLQLLKILLDYGLFIDTSSPETTNDTFLHLAASYSQSDIAELLLERGANISARNNIGNTPLILAAYKGSIQVLRILKESGADLNASNNAGRTALHYAAGQGFLDIVRYLVESGANTKAVDKDNLTPLDIAIKAGQKEVVKFYQFSRASHLKSGKL